MVKKNHFASAFCFMGAKKDKKTKKILTLEINISGMDQNQQKSF